MDTAVTLKKVWGGPEPAIGGWCTIPSASSAELMARAGFDWVCVDTQHGLAGHDVMVHMLQVLDITCTPSVVRVAWNEPNLIMRALDAGAQGVIVPMVNTPDDAWKAAAACRYPPHGLRSWGPIRASFSQPGFSVETANHDVICAVMVETQQALDNLDEILSVVGVDAIYIGPRDLAISLGIPPGRLDPVLVDAIQQIAVACKSNGKIAGISCATVGLAQTWISRGFNVVNVNTDSVFVRETATRVLQALKSKGHGEEDNSGGS